MQTQYCSVVTMWQYRVYMCHMMCAQKLLSLGMHAQQELIVVGIFALRVDFKSK